MLPTDAVRLDKIVTGTFDRELRYRIIANTNKHNAIILADNLSTELNNFVDCSRKNLSLMVDEYITAFTFVFGEVKAGFTSLEQPQIFVAVAESLPSRYKFTVKCEAGGRCIKETVTGSSSWKTSVYRGISD
jgi:hypothetical protein